MGVRLGRSPTILQQALDAFILHRHTGCCECVCLSASDNEPQFLTPGQGAMDLRDRGSTKPQTTSLSHLPPPGFCILYALLQPSSCNFLPTISGNTSTLSMEGDSSKPQLLQPGASSHPRAAACICTGEDW
ncbi:MAG: hypothetical protein L6R35_000497 [Caloplaca aegaea]|nr:MAG: hypothetical protein L6R35_000497 [Caloplaca aegaea]